MSANDPSPRGRYLEPGRRMSIYQLAEDLYQTVRWVRKYVIEDGKVPHTPVGRTEFFLSDDVIRWLDDGKIDPSEGPLD